MSNRSQNDENILPSVLSVEKAEKRKRRLLPKHRCCRKGRLSLVQKMPARCRASPQIELVTAVKAFLVEHYKQKLILQDIARHVGVSPHYLERLFKQVTAETPRSYLEKIRVDKAAHLLANTRLTNLEVCYEVGFQSPSNFYKAFRHVKQCSPSEYRRLGS